MTIKTHARADYYTQAADAAQKIAARADDFALDQLQVLRALIEHELIDDVVAAQRRAGRTWQEIGADLGISRQAAQQRYGGVGVDAPGAGSSR